MSAEGYAWYEMIGGDGQKTTLRYQLQEVGTIPGPPTQEDLLDLYMAADAIRAALVDLTGANINGWGVDIRGEGATGGLPDGGVDIKEEAVIRVDITPDNEPQKATLVRVPAPVDDIFVATVGENRNVLDVTNADVIEFVTALRAHALVSDGEEIKADNPLSGYRRWKAGRGVKK